MYTSHASFAVEWEWSTISDAKIGNKYTETTIYGNGERRKSDGLSPQRLRDTNPSRSRVDQLNCISELGVCALLDTSLTSTCPSASEY